MSDQFESRCGLYCSKCDYREKMNCPGCVKSEGKMFWGECPVAGCCMEKGHDHCGQCMWFPCDTLEKFSYDKEQGDDGQRIRNLEEWNVKG